MFLSLPYVTCTVNPPLSPPGAYLSQSHLWGGGGGGLNRDKGLFHLDKTMVLILFKELEYKMEKLKYKKLEIMQPRIENKSEL